MRNALCRNVSSVYWNDKCSDDIQAGNFISIYGLFNLVGGTYLKNYCNRAYQDLGSV